MTQTQVTEFPCKKCLVFPICKTKFKKDEIILYRLCNELEITLNCILLYEFLGVITGFGNIHQAEYERRLDIVIEFYSKKG